MARDRQRAKQRKARRAQNPGPAPSNPERENVPGELDHASGEVDRFEAELVTGADVDPDEEPVDELELEREAEAEAEADVETEAEAAPPAVRDTAGPVPTKKGAGRFAAFVRASWAELQRVQWPDRRQVAQATAVVLGFVVIAGAYLGLADAIAQEIVDIII